MSPSSVRPSRRVLLATAVLAASLLAGAPSSHVAHAMLASCRTDPIVSLSNGVKVQMSSTTFDVSTNVKQMAFTLHGPKGTSAVNVLYPTDNAGVPETFHYYADNKAATYDSYTAITDATSNLMINTTTILTNTVSNTVISTFVQTQPYVSGQQIHTHAYLS